MSEVRIQGVTLPQRRGFAWSVAGILAAALVLRVLHVWQLRDTPMFAWLLGDAREYDAWARQIASGDWLGQGVFYQAPLYPYFLGMLYAVFGDDLATARIAQALLGAFSCVLLALAGARFFSRRVGLIAGAILALYAPAIFYDGLIQKTVLSTFFLCLVLWLSSGDPGAAGKGRWVGAGAALGGMVLARENALPLAAAVVAWLGIQRDAPISRRLVWGGLFLAGLMAVLMPVGIRNLLVGGDFYLTTSQFGPNFYIGNNENATGLYAAIGRRGDPGDERWDATALAQDALGRELTPREVSAYWTDQALAYITSRPGHWLRLLGKKVVFLLNAREPADTEDLYSYADASMVLRGTQRLFHFGTLLPLAVLGAYMTWPRRRRLGLLYLLLGTYAATVVVFYVFGRYRFPLVPILVLFASAGLVEAPRLWRASAPGRLAVASGLLIASVVLCNITLFDPDRMKAQTYINLGAAFKSRGRIDEAIFQYRRAEVLDPQNPAISYNIGNALVTRGDHEAAIVHYRRALELQPDMAELHNNMAMAYKELGDLGAAASQFEKALELDSTYAPAHYNLGVVLQEQGDAHGAMRHFEKAASLRPRSYESVTAIAWVLAVHPSSDLRNAGRAIRLAEHAAELTQFRRPEVLDVLAAAYAAAGRFDEAVEMAERAAALASSQGKRPLAATIRGRLALYARGRPYAEPLPATD